MAINLEEQRAAFKEEAYELLEELEASLLDLEQHRDDEGVVAAVFRDLHTLKGSGGMFGFDAIATFTHELETLYDRIRKGELEVSKELINLSLESLDYIKDLLEHEEPDAESERRRKELLEKAGALRKQTPPPHINDNEEEKAGERDAILEVPGAGPDPVTYRICFTPPPDIQQNGSDVLKLIREIYDMGEASAIVHPDAIPALEELKAETCYLQWEIFLTATVDIDTIKDVFIFVEDESEIDIALIDEADATDDLEYKRIGQLLVDRGAISSQQLEEVMDSKKRLGEILLEEKLVEPDQIDAALVEQQHVRQSRKKLKKAESQSTIRVSSEKLDSLVNLVGELVIMQSNLGQVARQFRSRDLSRISKMAKRLIWELRDSSMEMRMSPIGGCFSKFRRLVRDLSAQLGKEVELVTEGGDTELDKTIIERLNDPLVHLIRNCIDHGIETPQIRVKKGKPAKGIVTLTAAHTGAFITITIKDDGAGISLEKVKHRALERGLMREDEPLTDREIFSFLFEPGFSTANAVTNISGRGVGMDVIKRNIEALRGLIHLQSEPGLGTSVILKIPLTLVIIDGLLIRLGDEYFIIQLSQVEKVVELNQVPGKRGQGGNIVNIHGKLIPYINLRDHFENKTPPSDDPQIVIVESEEKRVGILVDKVIGEYQTVIKSLGNVYKHIEGLSGATILGDGTIALILDVDRLVHTVGTDNIPARDSHHEKSEKN